MAVTWPPDTFGGCGGDPLRQARAGPADAGKVEGEAEGEAERPAAVGVKLAVDPGLGRAVA